MFNLKQTKLAATSEDTSYADRLADQNKGMQNDGLKATDKQLGAVRDNKDLIDTTEVQLDGKRDKVAETITEKQLGKQKSPLGAGVRNDKFNDMPVKPLDVLNQAQENERESAFKAARVKQDTEFWDQYVGEVLDMGPSQLPNHPDRFKSLSTDVEELVKKDSVKEMVMASLKDSDTMLFHVFYKAASQKRELTAEEQKLVDGINADKARILTAQTAPAHGLADQIERLQALLAETPVQSPDHERIQGELDQLIQKGKQMTAPKPQTPPRWTPQWFSRSRGRMYNHCQQKLLKTALHGHDDNSHDRLDQDLPWWNPYGRKRKSPNEKSPNRSSIGDQSIDGPNDGSLMGIDRDNTNEFMRGVHPETLVDQYDDGLAQMSPLNQDNGMTDTVMDTAQNQGTSMDTPIDSQIGHSPIGEHEQVMRKVQAPNLDSKPNRLPNGRGQQAKPFPRLRRSQVMSPMEVVWAAQIKKGTV